MYFTLFDFLGTFSDPTFEDKKTSRIWTDLREISNMTRKDGHFGETVALQQKNFFFFFFWGTNNRCFYLAIKMFSTRRSQWICLHPLPTWYACECHWGQKFAKICRKCVTNKSSIDSIALIFHQTPYLSHNLIYFAVWKLKGNNSWPDWISISSP